MRRAHERASLDCRQVDARELGTRPWACSREPAARRRLTSRDRVASRVTRVSRRSPRLPRGLFRSPDMLAARPPPRPRHNRRPLRLAELTAPPAAAPAPASPRTPMGRAAAWTARVRCGRRVPTACAAPHPAPEAGARGGGDQRRKGFFGGTTSCSSIAASPRPPKTDAASKSPRCAV